jgi:hypothetical protein
LDSIENAVLAEKLKRIGKNSLKYAKKHVVRSNN